MRNFVLWLIAIDLVLMGGAILGLLMTWVPDDRRVWGVAVSALYYTGGVVIGAVVWRRA